MSTLDPLCNPKTMSWMMKMGTFATVTADICSPPSRPTMKVSEEAERGGDEILHDDGQGEQKKPSVKPTG